ncbi:MAG: hypothetical protein CMJ47_03800 [Planctomyces sp.]|nr:hypothetical protein [Planctomyces sp.]
MKILLATASSGSRGGGELYFHALAKSLVDHGHEVTVAMSIHSSMDELSNILSRFCNVERIDILNTYRRTTRVIGATLDTRRQRRFADFVDRAGPDVLHINKQNLEDGIDLLLAVRQADVPSVATVHVTRSMSRLKARFASLRDSFTRSQLRRARVPLLATSNSCFADLQSFFNDAQAPRLYNVPNGAFASEGSRDVIREEWGIGPDEVVFGTVARIEPQKNPLFVCRLIEELPPYARFIWIGDGSMRRALEIEVARAGIQDRFLIEGWRDDARFRLSGLDVFVLPSLYEGFPFAVLEAMSAGIPCVVANTDGTRDAFASDQEGFLCPVNDEAIWQQRLQELCDDEFLRQSVGENAKSRYQKTFSLAAMAQRTLAVYKELIENPQKSPPPGRS